MTLVAMPPLTEEQTRIIEALKIPVDSFNPGTYWISSIDRESVMPTAKELWMIQSYTEYVVRRVYNQTYQDRILSKPFPAEGGHNTVIFRKGSKWLEQDPIYEKDGELVPAAREGARLVNGGDPREGWVYRRLTWTGGTYAPQWPKPRLSLIEVLDGLNSHGDRGALDETWVAWKKAHQDIFPEGS